MVILPFVLDVIHAHTFTTYHDIVEIEFIATDVCIYTQYQDGEVVATLNSGADLEGVSAWGSNPPPPPNGQSQQYKMQYYNIVVLSHGDALIYIKVAGSSGEVLTICKATLQAICGAVYTIWSCSGCNALLGQFYGSN